MRTIKKILYEYRWSWGIVFFTTSFIVTTLNEIIQGGPRVYEYTFWTIVSIILLYVVQFVIVPHLNEWHERRK